MDKFPSKQEVILLTQKIANSRENPDKPLSRNEFREQNHYQTDAVYEKYFGTFRELLKAAGLSPNRYETSVANKIAQRASTDIFEKVEENKKLYTNKYFKDNGNRFKKVIGCADLHDKDVDLFWLRCFLRATEQLDPDLVILNGDVFDFPEVSKYGIDPREYDPVGRVKFAREKILAPIRLAAPNATIDLISGNHEERLLKHLFSVDPVMREILSDFHDMDDIGTLFKLNEYEINYVSQVNLCAFTNNSKRIDTETWNKNYKVYYDSFLAHHKPEGRLYNLPGFNGHHHSFQAWNTNSYDRGSNSWIQIGAGCKRLASYTDGAKWNNGFIIIHVDTLYNKADLHYVPIQPTFAVIMGELMERREDEYYSELTRELQLQK